MSPEPRRSQSAETSGQASSIRSIVSSVILPPWLSWLFSLLCTALTPAATEFSVSPFSLSTSLILLRTASALSLYGIFRLLFTYFSLNFSQITEISVILFWKLQKNAYLCTNEQANQKGKRRTADPKGRFSRNFPLAKVGSFFYCANKRTKFLQRNGKSYRKSYPRASARDARR